MERVIYLKKHDNVPTEHGRMEILSYEGQKRWMVKEFRDKTQKAADADGVYDEIIGEEWVGSYQTTTYSLQRSFYSVTGKICFFYPDPELDAEGGVPF